MTKEELSAWEGQECHRRRGIVESWKVGFSVELDLLTSWTSLWRVHSRFPSGSGRASAGRKNAAGPGIAQRPFVLRFPVKNKFNHNTLTAYGSR